jgi:ubiquinone/menaquinone biosynthesis C-methylase UbiE
MLTAFDWKSPEFDHQETTVIDVGGGNGQVSYFLAGQTSHVHFIVQDLPNVVEVARTHVPEQLLGRIEFAVQNFFDPQLLRPGPPVTFLLRHVLHNWADKYCIQILNNLRPALQPGSKVLIYEYVLEDGPVKDLSARFGFQADMIMASLFNGQERRAVDFENIVKAADSRFVFNGVRKGPGRTMSSVIELEWR